METINITHAQFNELKKLYAKAVKDKAKSFEFLGNELLTDYAKYLIQYIETKYKI